MASFQLRDRTTDIIYSIKVSEFVFRNTFSINSDGIVTGMEETGYTSITTIGDNILEKIGEDNLINNTFEFVNNPNFYTETTPLTATTVVRSNDPTEDIESTFYKATKFTITPYCVYIIGQGISGKLPWFYFDHIEAADVATNKNTIVTFLPNFSLNKANSASFKPTFGFNFSQKQVARISPYYQRMQSFFLPNQTFHLEYAYQTLYGNFYPIYFGKPFTLRNNVNTTTTSNLYNLNSVSTVEGINNNTIKKYADLQNKEYVSSAGGSSNNIFNTFNMSIITGPATIAGMKLYDFYYNLLFDKIEEDNPYPDNTSNTDPSNPSGQTPPQIGGNPSGGDKTSENITVPSYPLVNPISTGSVNLYTMSADTFREFMSYLWSNPFFTAFIKLFQDPMQAVISAHIIGIHIPSNTSANITVGNVETSVVANVVNNNFITANFNYIEIPEFYKDSSDYIDTIIELYIPYHGYVTLNPLEVMGAKVYLQYTIDILTGAFVAFVRVSKEIDGTTLDSVLYQYNGNMAYQIPLSSVDYSSYITATLGLIESTITKDVKGIINSGLNYDIGYQRASNLASNIGYMSVKEAYITILRPIHSLAPNFAHYQGFPFEGYVNLGSCSGLTICREVYINNVIGTESETAQIRQLLMEGVIF